MKDEMLDMYVYLSETPTLKNFSDQSLFFWHIDGIRYGNWEDGENHDGSYTKTVSLYASQVSISTSLRCFFKSNFGQIVMNFF